MQDSEVKTGKSYQHSIFGRVTVLENLSKHWKWKYYADKEWSVWRIYHHGLQRELIALRGTWFDYEI